MAVSLHRVCVGACCFVSPQCGFSLSLFCSYLYLHKQSVTTRRRFGFNSKHEAPRELSGHRGIGIAADDVASNVSRVAKGWRVWAVGRGRGGWAGSYGTGSVM